MKNSYFIIKENSLLAWFAAKKMGTATAAMVLGKTIYLHNITVQKLLQNEKLLKHELCHIRQFKEHGYWRFLIKYLWESIRKGYHNNQFEIEARQAEEEIG